MINYIRFSLLLAAAWGAWPVANFVAAEPHPALVVQTNFDCPRATGPIKLDGRADEPAWTNAVVIDNFVAYWAKRPARTRTKARLLWDDDYLFFHAEMEDADLFADVREENGKTWENDVFELFFRPDEASPRYYELQVTPLNTHFNVFTPARGEGGPQLFVANKGAFHWKTVVVLDGTLNQRQDTDKGWSVEGRIPWSDFAPTGGKPKPGDTWRFALCRYDYSKSFKTPDLSSCAPLQALSFHRYEDYCRLHFIQAP
jgi:hypothetical protein